MCYKLILQSSAGTYILEYRSLSSVSIYIYNSYMCSEILLNSIVEQINKFIRAYYTQEKRFKSIYKQVIGFPGKIRLV